MSKADHMDSFETLAVKSPTPNPNAAASYSAPTRATTFGIWLNRTLVKLGLGGKEPYSEKAKPQNTPALMAAPTSFRFKPSGWFLIFLLIWLPLAAVVTVNNFLWIVFTMIIGVLTVSHVLAKRNLGSVTFFRRFPEEIYAQTLFSVRYAAKSSFAPWGSFGFTLRERGTLKADQADVSFPQVAADRPTEVTAYYALESRGDAPLEPAVISSTFPFGLAEYSCTTGQFEKVLVFPQLIPVEEELRSWFGGAGRGVERADAFGVVPYLFRDYVPGDRYKHIDWKKTARTGSLVTKILSDEGAREISIRLPAGASETAISRAASLAVHFLLMGRTVTVEGPGLDIEPGKGRDFARHVLTVLARWNSSGPGEQDTARDTVGVSIDGSAEFHWE